MTPQEKAKEMLSEYNVIQFPSMNYVVPTGHELQIVKNSCMNECNKVIENISKSEINYYDETDEIGVNATTHTKIIFWEEVKKEIEKL